jgi:hypothetical protein
MRVGNGTHKYDTSQGYFDGMLFHRHMKHTVGGIDLDCPAKMSYRQSRIEQVVTESGELVYALPGGGSITESGVIL